MIFTPKQIHFHMGSGKTSSPNDDGSEHTFSNKYYPLEMHIVHMNNIDKEEREIILMASLVTLIVENTILHLKLTQLGNKNEIYNFL